MTDFAIELVDWIESSDQDPRFGGTTAGFKIEVGGKVLTRLFDSFSRTVVDSTRAPLYPMAEWFAANWWRLHEESSGEGVDQQSPDWLMSHDLSAIGGGYVWPRLRFASDGQQIQVSARTGQKAEWESAEHLVGVYPPQSISVKAFDRQIEGLIALVLRRAADLQVSAEPLASIWADVLAERADPESAEWRRWEARLGYDPELAPPKLMEQLAALFGRAGKKAAEELAPMLGVQKSTTIEELTALADSPGVAAGLPMRGKAKAPLSSEPWEDGRKLARNLRKKAGVGARPIRTEDLLQWLEASDLVVPSGQANLPIGLGVLDEKGSGAILHFRRKLGPDRRFEAARFLADCFLLNTGDNWLPLTDRETARQRFQRSFAAELLAPIAEIQQKYSAGSGTRVIEDLADHFEVTELTIKSQLANHGLISPIAVVP